MTLPTVGYWYIRGIGEPIRYMLRYRNVEFEDKQYHNFEDWMDEKFTLGFDFPNLPYYIEGDVKITQSLAIMRYLACKHSLSGSSKEEKIRIAVAEQQLVDLRSKLIQTCYWTKDFDGDKEEHMKNLPLQFKMFSDFLGDLKFLAGDDISYVDFIAYDVFDFHWYFAPDIMDEFPKLKEYLQRIKDLPELKDHFRSQTRWPLFGPKAHFGGNGQEPTRE